MADSVLAHFTLFSIEVLSDNKPHVVIVVQMYVGESSIENKVNN